MVDENIRMMGGYGNGVKKGRVGYKK